MKPQSKRATYLDVKRSQLNLLELVNECIEENRPLRQKERNDFYNILSDSTLGLGIKYRFLYNGKKQTYDLGHMEHAAMWIAYRDKNIVSLKYETVEIKELWKKLRDLLFQIFPYAKTFSTKISQEQIHLGTALSGKV